jgi:hypothetical protein
VVNKNVALALGVICIILLIVIGLFATGMFSKPEDENLKPTPTATPTGSISPTTTATQSPTPTPTPQPNVVISNITFSDILYESAFPNNGYLFINAIILNNGTAPAYNISIQVEANSLDGYHVIDSIVNVTQYLGPQENAVFEQSFYYTQPDSLISHINASTIKLTPVYYGNPSSTQLLTPTSFIPEITPAPPKDNLSIKAANVTSSTFTNIGNTTVKIVAVYLIDTNQQTVGTPMIASVSSPLATINPNSTTTIALNFGNVLRGHTYYVVLKTGDDSLFVSGAITT